MTRRKIVTIDACRGCSYAALGRGALISLMPRAVVPVLRALVESEKDLCSADLAESTGLPPATVRYALRKLRPAGCVGTNVSVDLRLRYYRITDLGRSVLSILGGDPDGGAA